MRKIKPLIVEGTLSKVQGGWLATVTVRIWAWLSTPQIQAAGVHAAAVWLFEVRIAQIRRAGGTRPGLIKAWTPRVCPDHAQLQPGQRHQEQRLEAVRDHERVPEADVRDTAQRSNPERATLGPKEGIFLFAQNIDLHARMAGLRCECQHPHT